MNAPLAKSNDSSFPIASSETLDGHPDSLSVWRILNLMALKAPKRAGLFERRGLLKIARTAYANNDMLGFVETLEQGLQATDFTLSRPRLVFDPRLMNIVIQGSRREMPMQLLDAALMDDRLAWAELAALLRIGFQKDSEFFAVSNQNLARDPLSKASISIHHY